MTDERDLLTVPWTLLLQGMEQTIAAPTYLEGTHADRLDPDADAANFRLGTYFHETDRNVLYQSRLVPLIDPAHPTDPPVPTPCWVYVSGTMSAALASRPTDLGKPSWTNHHDDTGFRFHATDTGQDYQWTGTAWVDVSLYHWATYGTHAARLAVSTAVLGDGTLWCETDRNNVLYQLQGGVWWYVAGTMYGTMSPDQRPTDLGVHDGGFDFRSTDFPARQFLWSQTAWVEVTPQTGDVQHANSSGPLTLTATATAIPGASIVLNRAGRYLISGHFTFVLVGTGDFNVGLRGDLVAGGIAQPSGILVTCPSANTYLATSQMWIYQATAAGQTVLLRAFKDASGSGSSQTVAPFTSITAQWISP